MNRERYLQQRIHTLGALDDAISAMRSFSAHHFRESRQALPAIQTYRAEVEATLAAAGVGGQVDIVPPLGIVLIVSDLGLCGDYNLRLIEFAAETLSQQTDYVLYCIGKRPQGLLKRYKLSPKHWYHAPTSVDGAPNVLLEVAQNVLDDFHTRQVGHLFVISAEFGGAGKFTPHLTQILPTRLPQSAPLQRPNHYQTKQHLRHVATREYLYTILYELLLDALASEHGMRLFAAESANKWLKDTTEMVRRQLANNHRERITQELLDIVAGSRRKGLFTST
ncbi:F0F1 ATP synthase subunit gamma [Bremerella sp. P1]|uniref:F0F1 ATP synthase subunit gamma n=1 Tax=Bremerella sp. P1 TaxID=3026424 RepID=UPI0023679E26|nr:FoF1 ATP synthase subunit gamma [Bremerella sp. P1]WDI41701.1 F0F1 ATP synthase subunit gamma [Bremerella sp. P1]